jgi:hypothetical protein
MDIQSFSGFHLELLSQNFYDCVHFLNDFSDYIGKVRCRWHCFFFTLSEIEVQNYTFIFNLQSVSVK